LHVLDGQFGAQGFANKEAGSRIVFRAGVRETWESWTGGDLADPGRGREEKVSAQP
jgi:hypothetical protein